MTDGAPQVLVIEDHELVGATLVLGLRTRGYDALQCPVVSRDQILVTAAALPPGVALLDLDLGRDPGGQRIDGADLVADLTIDGWRVLALTGLADEARLAAAVAAGAIGIVAKAGTLDQLHELLDRALRGETLIPPPERRAWAERHRRAQQLAKRLALLTTREREILDDIVAGRRAGVVAEARNLSVTTVRTHIRAVLAKLDVSSQLEAVALMRGRPV
jgi:DNA-binding NarL/FixJ family response regulator